jgi:hypothetical protein
MKTENHDEHPNVTKYILLSLIKEGRDLPIGAIIGGCVGGLVFILIILTIYFICSRKSQNINETATAMHVNDMEVGIFGPLKEPDQTSALNIEDIYSCEAKFDNTSPMTAVHVNNIEVGISMPLKEQDQTLAKQRRSFDSTPSIHPPPPWVSGW